MKNRDRFVGLRTKGRKGLSVPSADGERAASRASYQRDQGGVPGFSAIEAFICRECGEGVNVERPVQ
jgi:hypothetical protein